MNERESLDSIKCVLISPSLPCIDSSIEQQVQYVKTISTPPSGGLDFNFSSDEEFSPDKLRANGERLYTTVIVGMLYFFKHVSRLQSWNEPARTSYFASLYFLAWTNDAVGYLAIFFLATIIIFPPSRRFLFPPIPLSLVDSNSSYHDTTLPSLLLDTGKESASSSSAHPHTVSPK